MDLVGWGLVYFAIGAVLLGFIAGLDPAIKEHSGAWLVTLLWPFVLLVAAGHFMGSKLKGRRK